MLTVTRYLSADGCEFKTQEACEEHELLTERIAAAMAPLGKRPDIPHGKYIQRTKEACRAAKSAMLVLVRERLKNSGYEWLNGPDDQIHPSSILGRILDDTGGPLNTAWGRLMRINWTSYREYDQPFFAHNESQADGPAEEPRP